MFAARTPGIALTAILCLLTAPSDSLLSRARLSTSLAAYTLQEGQKALRTLAAKKSSILSRIDTSSFQSSTKVRDVACNKTCGF